MIGISYECTKWSRFGPWLCLEFAHFLRSFVANLKIDVIYAFYPESFCDKNLAIWKVFVFSDSGKAQSLKMFITMTKRIIPKSQKISNLSFSHFLSDCKHTHLKIQNLKMFFSIFSYWLKESLCFSDLLIGGWSEMTERKIRHARYEK